MYKSLMNKSYVNKTQRRKRVTKVTAANIYPASLPDFELALLFTE